MPKVVWHCTMSLDGFIAGPNDSMEWAFEAFRDEHIVEHAAAPFAESAPGRVRGPEAMRASAEWLLAQFPDMHMTIEAVIADEDTVAVRILSEGTNLGALNGVVPPTGKRFIARQSHWFRVADGKLVEHWATRDDLTAMLQLGVIRPPGRPVSEKTP